MTVAMALTNRKRNYQEINESNHCLNVLPAYKTVLNVDRRSSGCDVSSVDEMSGRTILVPSCFPDILTKSGIGKVIIQQLHRLGRRAPKVKSEATGSLTRREKTKRHPVKHRSITNLLQPASCEHGGNNNYVIFQGSNRASTSLSSSNLRSGNDDECRSDHTSFSSDNDVMNKAFLAKKDSVRSLSLVAASSTTQSRLDPSENANDECTKRCKKALRERNSRCEVKKRCSRAGYSNCETETYRRTTLVKQLRLDTCDKENESPRETTVKMTAISDHVRYPMFNDDMSTFFNGNTTDLSYEPNGQKLKAGSETSVPKYSPCLHNCQNSTASWWTNACEDEETSSSISHSSYESLSVFRIASDRNFPTPNMISNIITTSNADCHTSNTAKTFVHEFLSTAVSPSSEESIITGFLLSSGEKQSNMHEDPLRTEVSRECRVCVVDGRYYCLRHDGLSRTVDDDCLVNCVLRCSEFLGCSSFGVGGILRGEKKVDGWYYLLTEDIGKWKHLGVTGSLPAFTQPITCQELQKYANNHVASSVGRDVFRMVSITVAMQRGNNGFGFTVVDEFPVRVGRVDLTSPADTAGLKEGDYLIKVNDMNVSRSTVASVSRLVKKSGHSLTLHVNRQNSVLKSATQSSLSGHLRYSMHSQGEMERWNYPDSVLSDNYPWSLSNARIDPVYESIPDEVVQDLDQTKTDVQEVVKNRHLNKNCVQGELPSNYTSFFQGNLPSSTPFLPTSHTPCTPLTEDDLPPSTPSIETKDVSCQPIGTSALTRALFHGSVSPDRKHIDCICRLMNVELDFIDFMQCGIKRYLRPLRHCVLDSNQHIAIFQNVEKLVNISEFFVHQINKNAPSSFSESDDSQSSEEDILLSAVVMTYISKVNLFCEAHVMYAEGLSEANQVLTELRQNSEFVRFLKEPPLSPGQPSISAFIFRPVQHIKEMSAMFDDILLHTAAGRCEYRSLLTVTAVLRDCVQKISNMSNARVQSLTSLTSHTTRSSSSSSSGSKTNSVASSSKAFIANGERTRPGDNAMFGHSDARHVTDLVHGKMAVFSPTQNGRLLNRDILHLQDKLVFPPNVSAFQLCEEDRHLIYQGKLFHLINDHWRKIQMVLLSDMILLCHVHNDGGFHILRDPVMVSDICHISTSTLHGTEFTLRACPGVPCAGKPLTVKLLFRSLTREDVSTWINVLDHRIQCCKRVPADSHSEDSDSFSALQDSQEGL